MNKTDFIRIPKKVFFASIALAVVIVLLCGYTAYLFVRPTGQYMSAHPQKLYCDYGVSGTVYWNTWDFTGLEFLSQRAGGDYVDYRIVQENSVLVYDRAYYDEDGNLGFQYRAVLLQADYADLMGVLSGLPDDSQDTGDNLWQLSYGLCGDEHVLSGVDAIGPGSPCNDLYAWINGFEAAHGNEYAY